ncbi:hypothetical protein SAMN05216526_1166 [Ectothiorhodosinus mongolicus]|uniref:Uncharacterized protein n=1 Tax=Ectothiorhodosinus mongolicus TaxID=233100 RepID=A0A1R3W1R7_9GAMM|nr:hypothetical protein [Ectothiorhodosinus mongolicus]ULX57079.1 hypothetical protein CKX93_04850 [Ectothiorhodosinus mongolicus]SIT69807.1 hypothetical protein SAMN05216526_1166 [Ectothiorhodosinus mongolicus]
MRQYALIIAAGLGIVAGSLLTLFWQTPSLALPERTLIVHVQNRTAETLPSVDIGYANVDTQQKTTILQLQPGETRSVVLNHEPGLGYTIEAHFSDGLSLGVCGGRHSESRVMREVIMPEGILSGIGEP